MKKQFLLLVGAVFTATTLFAQQPVNGGFETWTNADSPDSWGSYSKMLAANGLPGVGLETENTDVTYISEGSSSILIKTDSVTIPGQGAILIPGFATYGSLNLVGGSPKEYGTPFTARPDSISLSFAYFPVGGDSLFAGVFLTKNTSVVGGLTLVYGDSVPNLISVTFPIQYLDTTSTPDTLFIEFSSSNRQSTQGSKLYVDDVKFVYNTPTTVGINETGAIKSINMYPNPASSIVNVVIPSEVAAQNIIISDITGKAIKTVNNVSGTKVIGLDGLATGNYVVTFSDASTKAITGSKQLQVSK